MPMRKGLSSLTLPALRSSLSRKAFKFCVIRGSVSTRNRIPDFLNHNSTLPSSLSGLCTDEYLESIQPVWASFDAPPYGQHLAIAAFHTLMMLLGCSGNLFVIVVFVR